MFVTYDEVKRQRTILERGLDFADAPSLFASVYFSKPDMRVDYGEKREIAVGSLNDSVVVIVWTERDDSRRIISMRKANRDEQAQYRDYVDRPG